MAPPAQGRLSAVAYSAHKLRNNNPKSKRMDSNKQIVENREPHDDDDDDDEWFTCRIFYILMCS